ncbi:MAG: response regulator [Bacteroidota bacterium]
MSSLGGVLIAEDEEEIRELLAMIFEMEQFTVFRAVDGQHALEIFSEHLDEIALLITDLGLPRLGGVDLIEKVRALKPTVRIIGSSGYGRANVRKEVLAAGADDFMPKPFVAAELVLKAKKMLGIDVE